MMYSVTRWERESCTIEFGSSLVGEVLTMDTIAGWTE